MVKKNKFEDINFLRPKLVFLFTILLQEGTDVVLGTGIHCDLCTKQGAFYQNSIVVASIKKKKN